MRINPDVELCTEGIADLRHIRHAEWGAVQVADSAGDAAAMVLALSGCLVGLAVGAVLCVWAVVLHLNAKGLVLELAAGGGDSVRQARAEPEIGPSDSGRDQPNRGDEMTETDMRRELAKTRDALVAARDYLASYSEAMAALHCAATVQYSPLHARVTAALGDSRRRSSGSTSGCRCRSGWHDAEWRAALAELALEDCYLRMLGPHEVGRGCGFDVDFPGRKGSWIVWGSARDQVDGFGNAVSPAVGAWIGSRLRTALDGRSAA